MYFTLVASCLLSASNCLLCIQKCKLSEQCLFNQFTNQSFLLLTNFFNLFLNFKSCRVSASSTGLMNIP